MNLFAKSIAVLSAVFLLSACDTNPTGGAGADGKGGVAGGVNGETSGYLDADKNVGDRVFFDYDSSAINDEAKQTLEMQAAWLKKNPTVGLSVEGHCDERGTREYNIALGERRATAAKKLLVSLGVAANRITTISYGKERPAVVGSDESAWSQNRRAVSVATSK
jgi:peptidoglycan-associated lipoprotein